MAYANVATATLGNSSLIPSSQSNFLCPIVLVSSSLRHTSHSGLATDLNGYDIALFTDATMVTPIPFHLVSYVEATGTWTAFARMTVVAGGTFTVAVGDATVSTSQEDITSTYSGMGLVVPLTDTSGTSINDVDANNLDGTKPSSVRPTPTGFDVFPMIGAGQIFGDPGIANVSINYIQFPDSAALSPGTGDFCLSLNVRLDLVDSNDRWIYNDYDSAGNALLLLRLTSSNKLQWLVRDSGGSVAATATGATSAVVTTWYRILAVKSGTTANLYVNGVATGLGATNTNGSLGSVAVSTGTGGLFQPTLGCNGSNLTVSPFLGILNQCWVKLAAPSADYVTADYAAFSSPSTFISLGSFGAPGAGGSSVPVFLNQYRQRRSK